MMYNSKVSSLSQIRNGAPIPDMPRVPLRFGLLIVSAGLVGGCDTGEFLTLGSSPISAGIYIGERNCSSVLNNVESMDSDTIRFTIDNDGLLVLNGETIHLGLVNTFATGAVTQSSVIRSVTVTNDGFTIDWDTTLTVNGTAMSGYVLESFRSSDPDSFEFRSTYVVSSTGNSYISECLSILSR